MTQKVYEFVHRFECGKTTLEEGSGRSKTSRTHDQPAETNALFKEKGITVNGVALNVGFSCG